MLSKVELKYLKGEISVSSNYERVLKHRIAKKAKQFQEVVLLLLSKGYLRIPSLAREAEMLDRATPPEHTALHITRTHCFKDNAQSRPWDNSILLRDTGCRNVGDALPHVKMAKSRSL